MQRISKPLFLGGLLGSYGVGALLTIINRIIFLVSMRNNEPDWESLRVAGIISRVAFLPYMCTLVLICLLLYKQWDIIQDYRPRTTPGLAVGLMFVPCFGLYWIFQVYHGWTVDYNRYIEDDDIDVPRMPEGLALLACIWWIASVPLGFVPIVNLIVPIVSLVIWGMLQNRIIDGINALEDAAPDRRRRDNDDEDDDRRSSRSGRPRADEDDRYSRGRIRDRDRDGDDNRPSRGRSRDRDDDDRSSPRRSDDRISDRPSSRRKRDDDDDDDR